MLSCINLIQQKSQTANFLNEISSTALQTKHQLQMRKCCRSDIARLLLSFWKFLLFFKPGGSIRTDQRWSNNCSVSRHLRQDVTRNVTQDKDTQNIMKTEERLEMIAEKDLLLVRMIMGINPLVKTWPTLCNVNTLSVKRNLSLLQSDTH